MDIEKYRVVCYMCGTLTSAELKKDEADMLARCHRMWALTQTEESPSGSIAKNHSIPGVMFIVLATDPIATLQQEWEGYAEKHNYPKCNKLTLGILKVILYNSDKFTLSSDTYRHLH